MDLATAGVDTCGGRFSVFFAGVFLATVTAVAAAAATFLTTGVFAAGVLSYKKNYYKYLHLETLSL